MASRRFIEFFGASPNAFGNVLKAKEGDTSSAMFYGEKGQLFLHNIAKSFIDKIQALQKDDHYTDEGRRSMVLDHAKTLLAQLRREYKRFLDPILKKYQNFDSTHLPAIRPAADAVSAIRRMELRQYLSAQPGDKRLAVFELALKNNDAEVLGTFFERSNLFQLLGDSILKAGKAEYLRKNGGGDILDAEEAGSVLSHNIEKVAEELGLYANDPENVQGILAELPKLDWQFTPTQDFKAMAGGAIPSNLPNIMPKPMSDGQRLSAAGGNKM